MSRQESLKILFTKLFDNLSTGNPGHGSQFIKNTAAEKVQKLINKLLGFREEQKAIFESDPDIKLGDVTTVNLTTMEGGIQVSG
jgi:aminoacylase